MLEAADGLDIALFGHMAAQEPDLNMQASFDKPVRANANGFLEPSITALDAWLNRQQKLAGSLFGAIENYEFGVDENFSIDDLAQKLGEFARKYEVME